MQIVPVDGVVGRNTIQMPINYIINFGDEHWRKIIIFIM